jgi:hypothetical protein
MADMSQFRVAAISSDVLQIVVPVVFTRALQDPPQDNTFLISQTFFRDAPGWYVAFILRSQTPNSTSRSAHAKANSDEEPG